MHRSILVDFIFGSARSSLRCIFIACLLLTQTISTSAHVEEGTYVPKIWITFIFQDESTREELNEVSVLIWNNGKQRFNIPSGKTSKVEFFLPITDNVYDIQLERKGYVSKKLRFDLTNAKADSAGYSAEMKVALFRKVKAFDESVMQQPLGILCYSPSSDNFKWDLAFTARRRLEISKAKEQCMISIQSHQKTKKKIAARVQRAQRLFENRHFQSAIDECDKAFRLLPFDSAALAVCARAKDSADYHFNFSRSLMYNVNVAGGDLLFSQQEYEKALSAYTLAQTYNDTATYPAQRIELIHKLIEKQALQKRYFDAMEAGHQAYDKGRFQQAADKYREALRFIPRDEDALELLKKAEAAIKK